MLSSDLKTVKSSGKILYMQSAGKKNWVIIPVETKVRELTAKVLFAALAVKRGYHVILGESHAVRDHLSYLPAGIFVDKSMAPSRSDAFRTYRHYGNVIVSWCEEGFVFPDDEDYLRRKVSGDALCQLEMFYAWGKYQADMIGSAYPEYVNRILPVGNPRIDLLRPSYRKLYRKQVMELKQTYGRFVLINTNFARCNYIDGESAYFKKLKHSGKMTTPDAESFVRSSLLHKRQIMDGFRSVIPIILDRFPDIQIVIRPHPSENHESWADYCASFPRCHVVHGGSVIPWIMASEVLIHNGCTTGVEASLLDYPVIAYRPVVSEKYDMRLPNQCCYQAFCSDDLIASLSLILKDNELTPFLLDASRRAVLDRYLTCSEDELSCEMILDHFAQMSCKPADRNRRFWYFLRHLHFPAFVKFHTHVNHLLGNRGKKTAYALRKFSQMDALEVGHILEALSRCNEDLRLICVKDITDNIVMMHSQNNTVRS